MPKSQTSSATSDIGIVTRSLRVPKEGVLRQEQKTVPCTVKLDKLSQSPEKLTLHDGIGYCTLIKAKKHSYRIRILRTRNRSMPATITTSIRKMNRPDPRDKQYRHFQQSRGSGIKRPLNSSPEEYHKQRRFDSKYGGNFSGPPRGRGRGYDSRRQWNQRGYYGQRESRGAYRGFSSGSHFEHRPTYPSDDPRRDRNRVTSPEGRSDRPHRTDRCEESSRFPGSQDRFGKGTDHGSDRKRPMEPGKSQPLSSTYKSHAINSSENHPLIPNEQNIPEKDGSGRPISGPNKNALLKKTSDKLHAHVSPARSSDTSTARKNTVVSLQNGDQGLSRSANITPSTKIDKEKPNVQKQNKSKKDSVLPVSQEIERRKENTKVPVQYEKATTDTSKEDHPEGSPAKVESPVPNHFDARDSKESGDENSAGKEVSEASHASPKRVHSARKSAPSSNTSRAQRKDMLKKQALLKAQRSVDENLSSDGASSPTARMGGQKLDQETGAESALTPPSCEDLVVLSEIEDDASPVKGSSNTDDKSKTPCDDSQASKMPVSLDKVIKDNKGSSRCGSRTSSISSGGPDPFAVSEIAEAPSDKSTLETRASDAAETSEIETTSKAKDSDMVLDSSKNKEKALMKIKESLKKNLQKSKRPSHKLPQNSSRAECSSNPNSNPESPVQEKESNGTVTDGDPEEVVFQDNVDCPSRPSSTENKGLLSKPHDSQSKKEDSGEKRTGVCHEPYPVDNHVAASIAEDILNDSHEATFLDKPETTVPIKGLDSTRSEGIPMHISHSSSESVVMVKDNSDTGKSQQDITTIAENPDESKANSDKVEDNVVKSGAVKTGDITADDLSDISVDLGPSEPDDLDSVDDDMLLEDEPTILADYQLDEDKFETPIISKDNDDDSSSVTELSIARVESQSLDIVQETHILIAKRPLPDGDDAKEEPLSKKSKAVQGEEPSEEIEELDTSENPVVFTHKEWKEFARSIKEKYEKLVQTFNQKTNVMYEAQAQWQQETLTWKKNYEELAQKYEQLGLQVKENPAVEKQSAEVQTISLRKTHLSRRKKAQPASKEDGLAVDSNGLSSEQGNNATDSSSEAQTASTSGTALQHATSKTDSDAAAITKSRVPSTSPSPKPDAPATTKPSGNVTNLEAKRMVFKATLSKVMQTKKSSTTGETQSTSAPTSPSEQTSSPAKSIPVTRQTSSPAASSALPSKQTISPGAPSTDETVPGDSGGDAGVKIVAPASPEVMEVNTGQTSEGVTSKDKRSNSSEAKTTVSQAASSSSTSALGGVTNSKGPNIANTASGNSTAASQRETLLSKSPPLVSKTSKVPSNSIAITVPSSLAKPNAPTSTATTKSTAQAAKAPSEPSCSKASETSEKTKIPSATDLSKLPGSPKHSSSTTTAKVSEAPKDFSSNKSTRSQVVSEPEVIDLTEDPDPPSVSTQKSAALNSHKQQASPAVSKHTTLTTRSPHALVNSPPMPSPNASGTQIVTNTNLSNRVAPSVSGTVSKPMNGRQLQSSSQSPVSQSSALRPGMTVAQSSSHTRSGSAGSSKGSSPGVPQSVSPSRGTNLTGTYNVTSTAASLQLRNVNPPAVSTQLPGSNVRSQVVGLQHGSRQQVPVGASHSPSQVANTSQVLAVQQQQQQQQQQRQMLAAVTQAQNIHLGQVALQQRIQQQQHQQQQQQISLQLLQQGRQGVHHLPGAAASAAALATRQPQAAWLQQPRPPQQVSSSQQVLLTAAEAQAQMVRAQAMLSSTAQRPAQTFTTSVLQQSRPQLTPQQQQQQQQIQAQERAHAISQAKAQAKAHREQREQEQQHQARLAATRLQSSQLGQQQTQRTHLKKLQEEQIELQKLAQQQQSRKLLIINQMKRVEEYQRSLVVKLKTIKRQAVNQHVWQDCEKQLRDVQEQERKLREEFNKIEEVLKEYLQKKRQVEQQIHLTAASPITSAGISPQELQKRQLQQQQQQLHQQLQQQRQRQVQQQQQQQQQQQHQQESGKLKHPAALPDLLQLTEMPTTAQFTPQPLRPVLEIKHSQEGIVLSWKMDTETVPSKVDVNRYLLYAYQESESTTPTTDLWKKIGAVDALPLPMACTLTHFKAGSMYHFAVCAVSKHGRPGQFSNIGSINLP